METGRRAPRRAAEQSFKKSLRGRLRNSHFASKAGATAFGEGEADRL
jgi:hypothetical protein